ncbi:hypothetical protein QBC32DRAFT_314662 [Pseudoneurospora amorphoporcata]|uniref:Uncharacterized protein n=1 Tax=Pseudoneurospora amorphoporcata TaxID=241081 RepID=A0AAN6NT97_9PEZI|nr:hypothetical protein QBC32DRAFT_314662 [Pseudoneurospora amorphoporcata]
MPLFTPQRTSKLSKTGVEFIEYLVSRFQNVNLKIDAGRRFLDDSIKVYYLRNKINKRLRNALAYCDLSPENDFKRWLEICRTVAGNLKDADHR